MTRSVTTISERIVQIALTAYEHASRISDNQAHTKTKDIKQLDARNALAPRPPSVWMIYACLLGRNAVLTSKMKASTILASQDP